MIIALLPLTMYSVSYELASGRPYSKFEELLLHAVDAQQHPDDCTFADLRQVFQIHDRLLTEGLVTLIQEGWIAMEQRGVEIHYRVTEEGKLTLASGRRPSNVQVRNARTSIVRERLTGQLARASDLAIITGTRLRGHAVRKAWREALKPRMVRSALNGGEVERLLPHSDERHEWIRWIDSVARVSQDLHYLPIWVDEDKSRVLGLPYQWQHLTSMILQEVVERAEEFDNEAVQKEILDLLTSRDGKEPAAEAFAGTAEMEAASFAVATATCGDIALTASEARGLAEQVLASSVGNVLLVVGRLDLDRAAAVRDILINLGTRGIQVDLLWSCGESDGPAKEILRHLGAARSKAPGQVVFNTAPAALAEDLLIASTSGGPVAVVGSFIDPSADDRGLCPAVRLSEPGILAALARLSAGWWESGTGDEGAVPAYRWKYLGERWAAEGAALISHPPTPVELGCPNGGPHTCSGEVVLLTGPQRITAGNEIRQEPGPRLMIGDGGSTIEALQTEFADLPEDVGRLYRAFGGLNGWRFLRRAGDSWAHPSEAILPSPSRLHRVVAARDRWLITSSGQPEAALSFLLTGHLAVKAWERTTPRRAVARLPT